MSVLSSVFSSAEWSGEVLTTGCVEVPEPWGEEVLMGLAEAVRVLELLEVLYDVLSVGPLKALGHMHGVARSPHPHHCKPNSERKINICIQWSGYEIVIHVNIKAITLVKIIVLQHFQDFTCSVEFLCIFCHCSQKTPVNQR